MKTVHFVAYEKFLPHIMKAAEAVNPGQNKFVVTGKSRESDPARTSDHVIWQQDLHLNAQVEAWLDACEALFLHPLNEASAQAVSRAGPEVVVVWCGMGSDFYRYAPAFRHRLVLPHTQSAIRALAFRRNPWGFVKTRVSRRLGKRKMPPRQDPVADIVHKVDFFSAREQGLNLHETLPGFRATQVGNFGYYALEDSLTQGADAIDGPDILIGNSATWSNNHIDVFEQLRGCDLDGRKIVLPLSYGGHDSKAIGDSVVAHAHRLFGRDRVLALRDWMDITEYNQTLARCGVVFMNHIRGQAMGNISSMLIRGAKVFMRRENPYFTFLEDLGVRLGCIGSGALPADALVPLTTTEKAHNAQIMRDHWAWPAVTQRTSDIFDVVAAEHARKHSALQTAQCASPCPANRGEEAGLHGD